jgi:hypothetical protein
MEEVEKHVEQFLVNENLPRIFFLKAKEFEKKWPLVPLNNHFYLFP